MEQLRNRIQPAQIAPEELKCRLDAAEKEGVEADKEATFV
jgi:hypothetical protein